MKDLIIFFFLLIFSIFALSNIILPLIYTIPRLKKESKKGNLRKKVPLFLIIWAPILWTTFLAILYYYISKYYPQHIFKFYLAISTSILGLIVFSKRKDVDDDFKKTYGDYLKE